MLAKMSSAVLVQRNDLIGCVDMSLDRFFKLGDFSRIAIVAGLGIFADPASFEIGNYRLHTP